MRHPIKYAARGHHSLHTCRNKDDFLAGFQKTCGCQIVAVISQFVPLEFVSGAVLVGSIPLGIGTEMSDIDIIVLLASADQVDWIEDATRGPAEIVFAGKAAGEGGHLAVGEAVVLLNGVEVNLQFVLGPRVKETSDRLAVGRISLTQADVMVLSRLRTGWLLIRSPNLPSDDAAQLVDEALDVHWAVTMLVFALGDLEDARAALADDRVVVYHLGRTAVEKSFTAYFASRGHAFIGTKWLRFLRLQLERGGDGEDDRDLRALSSAGMSLLFPTPLNDPTAAADYLESVAAFYGNVRTRIERHVTYAAAVALCPQIYDLMPLERLDRA